jgi:hypothetical protein
MSDVDRRTSHAFRCAGRAFCAHRHMTEGRAFASPAANLALIIRREVMTPSKAPQDPINHKVCVQ